MNRTERKRMRVIDWGGGGKADKKNKYFGIAHSDLCFFPRLLMIPSLK